ncbi:MAG: SPOR domain-containing protein [Candidatus Omnitrophota bacterium]
MLEKNNPQLELFSKTKDDFQNKLNSRPFLSYIKGYEKIILVIIVFIITGVVSFSFGVEKGKSIAASRFNSRLDMAINSKVQGTVQAASQQTASPQAQVLTLDEKSSLRPQEETGNYTIQVASYQTKKGAQKEAEIIKKKGLSVSVLSKGAYSILCVGNFKDKQKAKLVLVELKKRYRDCFIRRL